MKEALGALRNHKSGGLDKVPAECYKNAKRQGNLLGAATVLSARLSPKLLSPGKAHRSGLLALLRHTQWMRSYYRRMAEVEAGVPRRADRGKERGRRRGSGAYGMAQEGEEDEGGAAGAAGVGAGAAGALVCSGSTGAASPRAFEHVVEAWSRCWEDSDFKEQWRDTERLIREAMRGVCSSALVVRMSYFLVQGYCAAGRIAAAVDASAAAARSRPEDADAVGLALVVRQLQASYIQHLRRVEVAADLPVGSGPALLGLRVGSAEGDDEAEEGGGGGWAASGEGDSGAGGEDTEEKTERNEEEDEEEGAARVDSEGDVEMRSPASTATTGDTGASDEKDGGLSVQPPRRPGGAAALLAAAVGGARARTAAAAATTSGPAASADDSESGGDGHAAAMAPRSGAAALLAAATAAGRGRAAAAPASAADGGPSGCGQDPSPQTAAGLVRSGGHCAACASATARGCLLHLDLATSGGLASPYEADVWAALDETLSRLAEEAAAAPRVPDAAPEEEDGSMEVDAELRPWMAPGSPASEARAAAAAAAAAARRKQTAEVPAVSLWREELEPELRDRAHWWPSTAFSQPPQLCWRSSGGGAAAATAADRGTDGALLLFPRGRLVRPHHGMVRHLTHRARVAALLMGPYNYYTQHVLYEMQLLREGLLGDKGVLAAAATAAAAAEARGGDAVAGAGPGPGGPGAGEGLEATVLEADGEALAADAAAVGAAVEAMEAASRCAAALARRLAPPAPPPPPPRRLPPALLAAVPRSLKRRADAVA
ncbi:hypothetical protein GPECTOR_2g1500 [Gonium pectorale]|uniref:Uncharacterized protein n=1 Tax=Gonium pectorale TaxID=33097 RepID=A0A150H1E9_GONPE|nr:hypothetical protein GPECTOR_2g1500 [Gonium pectorale]|eukprot:KXZ55949.1 hypothetical protein GPECTOR_2g1500 [Gonium pectorale]